MTSVGNEEVSSKIFRHARDSKPYGGVGGGPVVAPIGLEAAVVTTSYRANLEPLRLAGGRHRKANEYYKASGQQRLDFGLGRTLKCSILRILSGTDGKTSVAWVGLFI